MWVIFIFEEETCQVVLHHIDKYLDLFKVILLRTMVNHYNLPFENIFCFFPSIEQANPRIYYIGHLGLKEMLECLNS